jgi:hypothetical protein
MVQDPEPSVVHRGRRKFSLIWGSKNGRLIGKGSDFKDKETRSHSLEFRNLELGDYNP